MDLEQVRKSLGECAAGDGEDAKRCRAALDALDGAKSDKTDEEKTDEEKPGDDEEKKKEKESKAKAEAESAKAKAEAEADTKAKASSSNVIDLASRVQTLEAERQAALDAKERTELLASRPDLVPAVRAAFEDEPLPVLRSAMKKLPKGPLTASSPAAAAQHGVRPIVGQTQAQGATTSPGSEALAARMGLRRDPNQAIRFDGVTQSLGVLTQEDAHALAQARKNAATGGKS